MSLRTLGAVLKFALNLESFAATYYETATMKTNNQESKKIFEVLVEQGNKRIKKLKRIRRENTTEMILEPIKDLESEPYKFNTNPPSWDDNSLRELAKIMETKMNEFYTIAASKVGFLSEVAYSFEQLADAHRENLKLL